MGITTPIEEEQYNNLNRLRNKLLMSQLINDSKIEISEKNISSISKKIKQGKNEIKQFCHSLTKDELQIKAKKLMMLERDLEIEKKNYDTILNYNTLLKNNISQVETTMNELMMLTNTKDINKQMKKMDIINTSTVLSENINILLNQKKKEENINVELKNIDEFFNGFSKTSDSYLKEILGNSKIEENGGFY